MFNSTGKTAISQSRLARLRRFCSAAGSTIARWWENIQKIWSLKGAALITAVAVVVSAVQILIAVHGKLVILPFDVRSDQGVSGDLGSSFAASLSTSLNDYRVVFPSQSGSRPIIKSKNFLNLVESFLSDLPFVELPQVSPLNKGATVLEAIKVGPVSIPVSQVVFENLSFFHADTLRGTLELWGDQLTARVSLGTKGEDIVVSVPKTQGYRALINRLAAELLLSEKWISSAGMKPSALTSFAEGLQAYLSYDQYGEDQFVASAREKYAAALKEDPDSDLVRLHLAAVQYLGQDTALIEQAIRNFSLLLDNDQFRRPAKIGFVASLMRYIERSDQCSGAYRFLRPALQEAKSWEQDGKPPAQIEELLLWSGVYQSAAALAEPSESCAQWVRSLLPGEDTDTLFSKARSGFELALNMVTAKPSRYSADDAARYRFYIQLSLKYLLDDMVENSLLLGKPDRGLAEASLKLGQDMQADHKNVPEQQHRTFSAQIAASIADTYLQLGRMPGVEPSDRLRYLSSAAAEYRQAIASPESSTSQWAYFRLADLEMGHSDAAAAIGFLTNAYASTPDFLNMFDEGYLSLGILVEKPAQRCPAIALLKKGGPAGSLTSSLLLIDALRRQGDREGALAAEAELRGSVDWRTKWMGEALPQELSLIDAKLASRPGDKLAPELQQQIDTIDGKSILLNFEAYELAEIVRDDALATRLKTNIAFPPLPATGAANSPCPN